ncbi:hypothetical protein EV663_10722 [Rhodovulum bhavnagarense]|uniref:Uncharacterized protein n=1 Tax=Rhodovulum bhavnagarense TaxID=992286 RepID=A0A4R2REM4_9RHOB|nr:hypothetical protein EV663_10722 [Rhodovulum bhavnagarense]
MGIFTKKKNRVARRTLPGAWLFQPACRARKVVLFAGR